MLGLSEVANALLTGVDLFRGIAQGVLSLADGFLTVAETFTNGRILFTAIPQRILKIACLINFKKFQGKYP